MKKCPLCGNEYQDGTTCPSCGILLIDLDTNQAVGTGAGKKERKREEKRFGRKSDKKTEEKAVESQAAPAAPQMDWDYGLPMPEAAVKPEVKPEIKPEIKPEVPKAPEIGKLVESEDFNWEDVEVSVPEEEMELESYEEESYEEEEEDSFEEQETEEMPTPPAAPTPEMDWDYGLPKPDQLTGGAGGSGNGGGKGTGASNHRVKKEKPPKQPGKGFTFTITPPMIAIGVAIILLLVAGGFIISHFRAKKAEDQYSVPHSYEDYNDEYTEDDSNVEKPEELDLSNVDINAVEDSYMVAQGTLVKRGADYMLEMEESQNIYIYDRDSGENKVVEDVERLIVDVNYLSADVSKAYGREVILYGYLQMYDSDIVLEAEEMEKIRSQEDENAIHNYKIVIADCTWNGAVDRALSDGGYLVRINTREEYNHIINMLGGYSQYHFYLGGMRESSGREYYWIDENRNFVGGCLNSPDSWTNGCWFRNEPSFADTGYDANMAIPEDVMNLFCVNGTWYLNDSSGDLVGNYSGVLSGKVGYIVEYE